jgi:hypothetical protein
MSGPAARLIGRALVDAADGLAAGASPPIAVGWATVELDRAASELMHELSLPAGAFVPAADCDALGARCRVAVGAWAPGTAIAILEPATEGRLAEFLARHGEGPVAVWFGAASAASGSDHGPGSARPAAAVRAAGAGPFGRERLVPGGPVDRIHRFLVAAEPGTIGG